MDEYTIKNRLSAELSIIADYRTRGERLPDGEPKVARKVIDDAIKLGLVDQAQYYAKKFRKFGLRIPKYRNGYSAKGNGKSHQRNGKAKLKSIIENICDTGAEHNSMPGLVCKLVMKYN